MTPLTATLIHDPSSDTFTAFVNEYPGIVVQADSKDKAKEQLDIAWSNYITYLQQISTFTFKEEKIAV